MLSSLPNLLTLSRILAVPLFVLLMWDGNWITYTAAFALFCIAGVTDYLDGYLARAHGTVSRLGIFLDPIADKIMVAAVIVMLIHNDAIKGWTVLPALVILLREIAVSGLREFLAGLQVSLPVSKLAKWKTALQMLALGALLLGQVSDRLLPRVPVHDIGVAFLFVAAALTLVTGWDYLRAGMRHMRTSG